METSRTANSLRNIGFGALNRITSIVFPFIVRTIFIKVLGEEYLGLNSLYSSILQVLNLADLGFASAITASMYKPLAEKDTKKVCALLNFYKKIYRIIGIGILSVGLLLTPFIAVLINGKPPAEINIYLYWILYLVNTVISYLFYAYDVSLLNAIQRNDIVEKIGTISRICTSLIQIYVVAVLNSFILYVLLNVICTFLYNIMCHWVVRKKYPQYCCQGYISKENKESMYRNVFALSLQKIGNTVSLSLDSIVISAFLGLTTVAIYGNYFYVISAIQTFILLIYSSITASIGNSIATETTEKNYNDFKKFSVANIWIVGWCAICFVCIFQDFMIVWMGKDLLFAMPVVLMLVFRFYSVEIRKVVLTYKDAAGLWWYDKWRPIVGCVVNFVLNILFVKKWGVLGIALATIISYLLIELPWETHAIFKNYFHKSSRGYYKLLIVQTLKVLISGLVTYIVCSRLPIQGISAIAIKLGVCMILPNCIFILCNLRNGGFKVTFNMLVNIVKRIFHK